MTSSNPNKIFINGPVITMDTNFSVKQALATTGARITAVGDKSEILSLVDKNTEIIDLQGRTLLPGFIDAHSHFLRAGLYDTFNEARVALLRMEQDLNVTGITVPVDIPLD